MLSNHLILCCPLFLLSSILPGIRVLSNESALRNKWPKYWSFSFNISPSNEYSGWFPLGLTDLISLESKGLSRVFSSTTVQKHKFFSAQPSLWSNSHIHRWLLQKQELWPIRYKRLMLDLLKTCKLTLCLVSLNLEKCSTGVDADIMPWYVIWKCSPLPPAEWTQQRKIRV